MKMTVGWPPLLVLLGALCTAGWAAPEGAPGGEPEGVYGRQLMTPLEEDAYRRKMWELRTEAERERFRREHHRRMQERARDLGVHLPDDPVYLDRPYFEKGPEGGRAGEGSPPADSLRRWPPKEKGKNALRRWPAERGDALLRSGSRGADSPSIPEERPEGERRWPPARNPSIGPAEPEEPPAQRTPPGAGKVNP